MDQHQNEQVNKKFVILSVFIDLRGRNYSLINYFHIIVLGDESIRMYGGRRKNDNGDKTFHTLMDDNSD